MGLFGGQCPLPITQIEGVNTERPIIGSLKFATLLFCLSAAFSLIALLAGGLVIFRHLNCYVRPREQRQIVRLGFYPVVFSAFSCFAIYSYPLSVYFDPAAGLYEPVALTSLFLLFVEFAEPEPGQRDAYFKGLQNYRPVTRWALKKKFEPVDGGSFRWFQAKWVALFCYFIFTIILKSIQMVTQGAGVYCQSSYSPKFAHIYVVVLSSIFLPVGVIAVVQFHLRMVRCPHFTAHHATAKLLSFKAVLALNFFQQIIFEVLLGTGTFKGTKTVTMVDFQIGIPALLLCIEQAVCAVWFNWSFSTREYHEHEKLTNAPRLGIFYALLHALNPMDLVYGSWYALRLIFKGIGPWNNGSWTKWSKYSKIEVKEGVEDVRLRRSRTYRGRSRGDSDSSTETMTEEEGGFRLTPAQMEEGGAPGLSPLPRATSPMRDASLRPPSPYDPMAGYGGSGAFGQYGYDAVETNQAHLLSRPASPGRGP